MFPETEALFVGILILSLLSEDFNARVKSGFEESSLCTEMLDQSGTKVAAESDCEGAAGRALGYLLPNVTPSLRVLSFV